MQFHDVNCSLKGIEEVGVGCFTTRKSRTHNDCSERVCCLQEIVEIPRYVYHDRRIGMALLIAVFERGCWNLLVVKDCLGEPWILWRDAK
jgi:hypothetical protein